MARRESVISALEAWRATRGPCVLFESTGGGGARGRRTLLARHPRAVLVADRDGTRVATAGGIVRGPSDPLAALRTLLESLPEGEWPEEGAVAGALAYDFARPGPEAGTPRLVALAVDRLLVEEEGLVLAPGSPAAPPLPDRRFLDERSPVRTSDRPAPRSLPVVEHDGGGARAAGPPHPGAHRRRRHLPGEPLPAIHLPWTGDAPALYERLRRTSPAPFSGYFRAAAIEIVSASPERLLEVEHGRATTRPIAGTRPRSPDPGLIARSPPS